VSSNSDFAFENLKKDFMFYLSGEEFGDFSYGKEIKIRVFKENAPYHKVPALGASLNGRGFICYKDKNAHYIDYAGCGLMVYDFKNEIADIYSKDENLLYEKARLTILSRVGELLDNRHIHRLHALGLAKDGKATLCLLPMEAGKTTL